MRFSETIQELKKHDDVAVNCDLFLVRSLSNWIEYNEEYVTSFVKLGRNPKRDERCMRIKINAEHILEEIKDQRKIHAVGWMPNNPFSIYPLK